MAFLSKVEEIILLAIWKLQDNAYGLSISEQVEKDTGVTWLSGSVYGGLNRLKKNGYISTVKITHSGEQAGRPRIFYKLTPAGKTKLAAAQKVNQRIWVGVPNLEKKSYS